ncbi:MAG: hypothetical protein KHZ58_00430 [Hungatella hathewayi]|nr:hypothetical protein [Hungatella hathewayi]
MGEKRGKMMGILAVDAGSTNLKAALLGYDGKVIIQKSCKTPLVCQEVYVEGEAGLLYEKVVDLMRDVISESEECEVKVVCIASQMTSLLCLDGDMEPISSLIYGIDTRGDGYLGRLEEFLPLEKIYEVTGCPIKGIYWPGKLMWMREHCPDVLERTRYLVGAKEYLLYRLTGELLIDCASASTTQIYDQENGKWWKEMLDFLDMDTVTLPEIRKPYEQAGLLNKETAEKLGIIPVPVLVGSGDGPVATISSGGIRFGDCCISFGTTTVTRLVTNSWKAVCPEFFVQHLDDGVYLQGIRINDGGRAAEPYIRASGGVEQPAEGAFYMEGKFYPKEPPTAGGKMAAVLNGVLFQIYAAMLPTVRAGEILRILPTGGGSGNAAYMQRTANLFQVPVAIMEQGEAFAGLAALALVYEKMAEDLFSAASLLSLEWRLLTPKKDRELEEQFHRFSEIAGRKVGASFE